MVINDFTKGILHRKTTCDECEKELVSDEIFLSQAEDELLCQACAQDEDDHTTFFEV